MPNQITHYYHGMAVMERLEGKAKEIVGSFPEIFKVGCIGPDIMFVIREIGGGDAKRYANEMQYLKMYEVFNEAVHFLKDNPDEAHIAYMLGLLCHYVMDLRGHAYVNYFVEAVMPKYFPGNMQSALHPLLESGLDEHILIDYLKVDPRIYSIGREFRTTRKDRKKISRIYAQVINDVIGFDVPEWKIRMAIMISRMFFFVTTDKSGRKKKMFDRRENRKGIKKQMSSSIRPPYLMGEYDFMNRKRIKWRKVRNMKSLTDESFDMVIDDCINKALLYIDNFLSALEGEKGLEKKDFTVNYEGVKVY